MKPFRRIISIIVCLSLLLSCSFTAFGAAGSSTAVIDVDGANLTAISENLFGIFFEDINFAADGGLSSNLINNNSFEQRLAWAPDYDCRLTGWEIASGTAELSSEKTLNKNNPNTMKITNNATVLNQGYPDAEETFGIYIEKGQTYDFYFFADSTDYNGNITVSFIDADGKIYASADFTPAGEYKKYSAVITGSKTGHTKMKLEAQGNGTLYLDMFSLVSTSSFGYGEKEWKYSTLRPDLVKALDELNPSFVRFPGGCLVEGAYDWDYVYNWKNTIGSLEERVQIPNLWGYNQSMSVGYYEYFLLCEALDAQPIPVVHSGLMCQSRGLWLMDVDSPEFRQHIQDVLDLIEYANGTTDTEWGAVRAENGHPEPFGLKYIAIGNENWNAEYWDRFPYIYEAVKQEYPDINIISTSGPWADGDAFEYAWNEIDAKYTDTIVDEHYYVPPWWVYANYNRYDAYDRNGAKVFVGEYAVHRGGGEQITKNNLQVAIDEAVHVTSLIRNGDIVELASYAPLFARNGYTQWAPNLIWFNTTDVVKTPSYYVQQLYMNNTGNAVAKSTLSGNSEDIYQVVSVDTEEEIIYAAVVNVTDSSRKISLNLNGFENIYPVAQQRYLGNGLYNTANRFGAFSDFISPRVQYVRVNNGTISKSVGPHSLNIFCIAYGDNQKKPESAIDYKTGSQLEIRFFEFLEDFVVWFRETALFKWVEGLIKK
ncbi:MAG: alpha-N-arabinofuranosidase [Clostridia bacterium]|nr:alpha-N-arabinofuranosidase [Clostridia bacterium]